MPASYRFGLSRMTMSVTHTFKTLRMKRTTRPTSGHSVVRENVCGSKNSIRIIDSPRDIAAERRHPHTVGLGEADYNSSDFTH
jgi:hypothetical protein